MPARTAIRAAIAVLAGTAILSALAACSVDIGALQHRTNSYSLPGQLRTLAVNAHTGGVHVTGSDSGKVSVTEHIAFRGTAPGTTHRTAAGALTLDSSCPALETCTVSYDITVPRTMTARVTGDVGDIQLRSLSGQVTVHANVGDITLGSVSGPVEATGHAVSIRGQDVSSPRAALHVSAGTIDVAFSAAPARVTATIDIGSVTLHLPGGVPYNVTTNVRAGSAHVGVTRSPASPHVITASTRAGWVTIEPAA